MRNWMLRGLGCLTLLIGCFGASAGFAQDAGWRVSKMSGDVWVASSDVQTVSLTQNAVLNPGDRINTGRNGRVLLVRGEETILVSPNSAIGIPTEKREGLATTITQQAGSILLNVEKKNVQHFSVETPYLAAVVKGTQFRVTVNSAGSRVDVIGGSVEVADFKTGQFALVAPGQAARVSVRGVSGLSLQGPGTLAHIQKGTPRESSVKRIPVPRGGLTAPHRAVPAERRAAAPGQMNAGHRHSAMKPALRISAPLGEVAVDFKKVTKGLARGNSATAVNGKASKESVWSAGDLNPGNGASKEAGKGNNGAVHSNVSSTSGSASASASTSSSAASVTGNSNGNGNGNANGLGNGNGKGNAFGLTKEKENNGKAKGKNKG